VAQELLIQALQEELESKARMSQQQLQELQADLQAAKEKEMLEMKKANLEEKLAYKEEFREQALAAGIKDAAQRQ
jgi:hypothetical protein